MAEQQKKRTEMINEMLEAFESTKRADGTSLSVSEYIRLLQIYEEMAEVDGGEVVVRWVDTWHPVESS